MKGLLHSKYFKTNLKKWLFMYVGVMLLFTTVVTYSKYISRVDIKDEARATRFNVVLYESNKDGINCSLNEEACEKYKFRPDKEFSYFFTLDKSEIEVKTKLVITLETIAKDAKGKDMFKMTSIKNLTTNEEITYVGTNADDDNETNNLINDYKNNIYLIIDPTEEEKVITYEVKLKYNDELKRSTSFKDSEGRNIFYNTVKLSYSAVQKIN